MCIRDSHGVDDRSDFLVDDRQGFVEIERLPVPVRVVVRHLERPDRNRRRSLAADVPGKAGCATELRTWHLTGEYDLPRFGFCRRVRPLHCADLRPGEAILRVAGLALERRNVERALPVS